MTSGARVIDTLIPEFDKALRAVFASAPTRRPMPGADLPEAERPRIEVMNPGGPAFGARHAALKQEKGAAFTICDLQPPVRQP